MSGQPGAAVWYRTTPDRNSTMLIRQVPAVVTGAVAPVSGIGHRTIGMPACARSRHRSAIFGSCCSGDTVQATTENGGARLGPAGPPGPPREHPDAEEGGRAAGQPDTERMGAVGGVGVVLGAAV